MNIKADKRRLSKDFFGALEYEISEEVQNDPDFQVYACDVLNDLIQSAKEIDTLYGGRRISGVSQFEIIEIDEAQAFIETIKAFFTEIHWQENFGKIEEFVIKNRGLVSSQPSIAGAVFIRAVEVAKTDSLKLLFKMSATI